MLKPIREYKYYFREGFKEIIKNFEIEDEHEYWYWLSGNPNANHLLEKNLEKVVWSCLSTNPNAIPILEKNLDKVDWWSLSRNENAIHLLENNLDKVSRSKLSENPNIFVDEYEIACRDYFKQYVTEEFTRLMFHPKNIDKFKDWGFEDADEDK